MSRTDHPRKPRISGHRVSVRSSVKLYGGRTADQSVCTCGLVGPLRGRWVDANQDGRDHLAAVRSATATEHRTVTFPEWNVIPNAEQVADDTESRTATEHGE